MWLKATYQRKIHVVSRTDRGAHGALLQSAVWQPSRRWNGMMFVSDDPAAADFLQPCRQTEFHHARRGALAPNETRRKSDIFPGDIQISRLEANRSLGAGEEKIPCAVVRIEATHDRRKIEHEQVFRVMGEYRRPVARLLQPPILDELANLRFAALCHA